MRGGLFAACMAVVIEVAVVVWCFFGSDAPAPRAEPARVVVVPPTPVAVAPSPAVVETVRVVREAVRAVALRPGFYVVLSGTEAYRADYSEKDLIAMMLRAAEYDVDGRLVFDMPRTVYDEVGR